MGRATPIHNPFAARRPVSGGMQMLSGIGRLGTRLLALFLLAVIGLGIAALMAALPTTPGPMAFLGVVVASLGALSLAAITFTAAGSVPRRVRRAKPEDIDLTPDPALARPDAAGVDFLDLGLPAIQARPAGAPRGSVAGVPVARTAEPIVRGEPLVAAPRDPRLWPDRRPGPGTVAPKRQELTRKYTQTTPLVRGILAGSGSTAVYEHIPEVTAELPRPGQVQNQWPEDKTRGRCGSCNTIVFAPTVRPLRLRCPACSKTTLLR